MRSNQQVGRKKVCSASFGRRAAQQLSDHPQKSDSLRFVGLPLTRIGTDWHLPSLWTWGSLELSHSSLLSSSNAPLPLRRPIHIPILISSNSLSSTLTALHHPSSPTYGECSKTQTRSQSNPNLPSQLPAICLITIPDLEPPKKHHCASRLTQN